jgi:hypothetical protein
MAMINSARGASSLHPSHSALLERNRRSGYPAAMLSCSFQRAAGRPLAALSFGCLTLATTLLAAPSDDPVCKTVIDAAAKMEQMPNHQYMTITRKGGKTTEGESVHLGDTSYVKVDGTWRVSPLSPKDIARQREENIRDSKVFTCKYERDEEVNGEPAAVYLSHQESDDVKADAEIWISKKRGLVLKEVVNQPTEQQRISIRVEYENVKKPEGVK